MILACLHDGRSNILHNGSTVGLDVHFEDPTAGFFFRESRGSSSDYAFSSISSTSGYASRRHSASPTGPTTSIVLNSASSSSSSISPNATAASSLSGEAGDFTDLEITDDILHSARFSILKTAQPVLIRAEYGPFEQRQTVPTQYVVPDLSEGSAPFNSSSFKPGLITDFKPHGLDLSAHPVNSEIPRDKPVLRVLFHAGGRGAPFRSSRGIPRTICVRLHAVSGNESRSTSCSPDGRDGTCLAQITLPSRWWPSLVFNGSHDEGKGGKQKTPKISVSVSYSVEEARGNSCSGNSESRVSLIPETHLSKIPLVQPRRGYRQLAQDEILHMLIPQAPLYPNSRLYVPVFLDQPDDGLEIAVVKIRCRSRSGIKILGVEETSSEWSTRTEINSRNTLATVTAFRKKDASTFLRGRERNESEILENQTSDYNGPAELFNWLLSVDDRDFEIWNAGKISWVVEYQYADTPLENGTESDDEEDNSRNGKKLKAKLHVQKDDAQAVLPIAKQSELMNLAVLTGRQVSKPLKIFTVTEAGEIADVTLRSSCTSTDNSVLKVSSSCTSVYVDGSETRGALNAQINVKYGNLMGTTLFVVWMPELPLKIDLSDSKLSLIKSWRVPSYKRDNDRNLGKGATDKDGKSWYNKKSSFIHSNKLTCSLRYQQSTIQIYASFIAEDLDSGRKEFYPSRGSELDVTELLISNGVVRIANSGVALLRRNIIQGLSPGKTNVHVMSPISGKEIGKAELRVAKNRESISGINVRILSGLKLSIHAEQGHHRRGSYSLQTAYSKILTTKYQEGLVDVSLVFSDESVVSLSDIDTNEYYLSVKSLDPRTVAFAPRKGGKYPRIIAVGSGRGKLLRISLELPTHCASNGHQSLASRDAEVIIKIKGEKKKFKPRRPGRENVHKPVYENQSTLVEEKKSIDMGDMGDMIQDEEVLQPFFGSGRRHIGNDDYNNPRPHSGSPNSFINYSHLTPLEVGLYVLLAVFCATIAIFVASCFVYASRHRKMEYPMNGNTTTRSLKSHQSVQNAHDWVWLGKSTSMDDKSVQSNFSAEPKHRRYRQRASYMGSEVNVIQNPRTEEYELSVSDPNTPMVPLQRKEEEKPPEIPPHQNICGVRATNPFLYDTEELEENPSGRQRFESDVYDTVNNDGGHHNPFGGGTFKQQNPVIDSSTYTKKSSSINPNSVILPVGFPIFSQNENVSLSSASSWEDEEEDERHSTPPLRQSPASALPPMTENDFIIRPEDIQKPRGEYIALNPDIEKPSPPRKGTLIENPFRVIDDGTYVKKRGNVVGNPMFPENRNENSTEEKGEDIGMDYDQLMSYFESLKESTA